MRKLSCQKSPLRYALIYNIWVTHQQKHHQGTEQTEHNTSSGPGLDLQAK